MKILQGTKTAVVGVVVIGLVVAFWACKKSSSDSSGGASSSGYGGYAITTGATLATVTRHWHGLGCLDCGTGMGTYVELASNGTAMSQTGCSGSPQVTGTWS